MQPDGKLKEFYGQAKGEEIKNGYFLSK